MSPDRRQLAAGIGAALLPLPALAAPPSPEAKPMPRLLPVLQSIIAAWRRQDVEGVLVHVTDDIVWRNASGFAPAVRGKAAMRQVLNAMAGQIARNEWRLFDYAENDDRLFMEGVDEFWLKGGQHVAIPYAGSLQFRGLLVAEWREYFDGRISAAMKAGAAMTPEVAEMLDRPVIR